MGTIMKNIVVALSRQFGSGGRLIGQTLAEQLGINYYDKVLLTLSSEKSGLSTEFIERLEEQASSSFLFNLSTAAQATPNFFYRYDVPANDKAFFAQTAVIKELAAKESCVIVGRCADYILRNDKSCLKVFVHASKEMRLKRLIGEYGMGLDEAHEKLMKMDKGRANYYRHYTGEEWGKVDFFDLSINTDTVGVDGAVRLIKTMVNIMQ